MENSDTCEDVAETSNVDPIRIVQRSVNQETYDYLDRERYRWLDRLVQTRTKLQDDILPNLGEPAHRVVRDYIMAEQELRAAEFRFICVKVDDVELALDAEPIE